MWFRTCDRAIQGFPKVCRRGSELGAVVVSQAFRPGFHPHVA